MPPKRTFWKTPVIIDVLNCLIENYMKYKKRNRTNEFYEKIGKQFNMDSASIINLLKNLGRGYREVCLLAQIYVVPHVLQEYFTGVSPI